MVVCQFWLYRLKYFDIVPYYRCKYDCITMLCIDSLFSCKISPLILLFHGRKMAWAIKGKFTKMAAKVLFPSYFHCYCACMTMYCIYYCIICGTEQSKLNNMQIFTETLQIIITWFNHPCPAQTFCNFLVFYL